MPRSAGLSRVLLAGAACTLVFAAITPRGTSPASAAPGYSTAAKKVCKTVTKKVHGKKKKVKVCHKVKPAASPTPTATPTATPTDTATTQPADQVSQTPAYPGAPAGGFIAGLSTTVTLPPMGRNVRNRAHQTGTEELGGVNLSNLSMTATSTGRYWDPHSGLNGAPAGPIDNVTGLTLVVADGSGFLPGQRVCLWLINGKPVSALSSGGTQAICTTVDTVSPQAFVGAPNAASLTMKPFDLDSGTVRQLKEFNPREIVVRCESLGFRVSPGTPLALGEILSLPLILPSGTRIYTGVVDQIDIPDGLAFVPGLDDILGPSLPLDPAAGASVLPPGTLITPIVGQSTGSADFTRLTVRISVFLPAGSPLMGGMSLYGFTVPNGSTVDGCLGCQIQNVTGPGIPHFNVTNQGQQLSSPLTIRVDNASSPADDLGPQRSGVTVPVLIKYLGQGGLDELLPVNAQPLEQVVGPIRANFVQDPCPATMPLPLPHTVAAGCTTYYRATAKLPDGSVGEPYEILPGQPPLTYSWAYATGGISGAVKCGVFTNDPADPAWFSWYHPGQLTDPAPEPTGWCSHLTPYHLGEIGLVVSDAHYNCTEYYPWGSRGVPDPTSGLPPEYSDYYNPIDHPGYQGDEPLCIPTGN